MAKTTDISRFLPAGVKRLQKLGQPRKPKDRRKRKRLKIDELNALSKEELNELGAEIKKKQKAGRTTFTKVLDVVDVPRNIVGNVIGSLVGVDKDKLRPGTILPKVTGGDILRKMGVKNKVARGIGGFALDVATDPLLFLGAGAQTGKRLVAGATKQLPKFNKMLRGAVNAAARVEGAGTGASVPKALALGLGSSTKAVERLVQSTVKKFGVKNAVKQLADKGGGFFTKRLGRQLAGEKGVKGIKAAAGLVTKHAEKGRTIARIPWTQAGIVRKTGKTARQFKELSSIAKGTASPEILASVKELAAAQLAATAKGASVAKAGRELAATSQEAARGKQNIAQAGRLQDLGKAQRGVEAAKAGVRKVGIHRRGEVLAPGVGAPGGTLAQQRAAAQAASGPGASQLSALSKAKAGEKFAREQALAGAKTIAGGPVQPGVAGQVRPSSLQQQLAGARQATAGAIRGQRKAAGAVTQAQAGLEGATGRLSALQAAPGSPEFIKALGAKEFGTAAKTKVGRFFRSLFGGPRSPLTTRISGLKQMADRGARDIAQRAVKQLDDDLVKLVPKFVNPQSGVTDDEFHRVLRAMTELRTGEQKGRAIGAAGGQGLQSLGRAGQAADTVADRGLQLLQNPKYAAIVQDEDLLRLVNSAADLAEEARVGRNVVRRTTGQLEDVARSELGYFARTTTQEGDQAIGLQRGQAGVPSQFNPERARIQDLTNPQTGEVSRVLVGSDKFKTETARGFTEAGKSFAPSTEELNALAREGKVGALVGKGFKGNLFEANLPASVRETVTRGARESAQVRQVMEANKFAVPINPGDKETLIQRGLALPNELPQGHPNKGFWEPLLKGSDGRPRAYPQVVADELNEVTKMMRTPAEVKKLVGFTDTLLNHWKALTLVHPAYMGRNAIQAGVGALMVGGPARPGRMLARMRSKDGILLYNALANGAKTSGKFITIAGQKHKAEAIEAMAKMLNLGNSGFSSQIAFDQLSGLKRIPDMLRRGYGKWFAANNVVETQTRVGLWLSFLDDGLSFEEAAMKVIRAIPDMTDLTLFEKNVMRRIFPWYSWMRRNMGNQVHFLINQPSFAAGAEKLRNAFQTVAVGDDFVPESLRPDWQQEQQAMQIMGDSKEGHVFLLASWLPFQDMIRMASGAFSLQEGAKAATEQMRPGMKFLFEMATGHDIFKRQPVSDLTPVSAIKNIPAALVGASGTPLDSLMAIRPAKAIKRIAFDFEGVAPRVSRAVLGGAIQPISKERGLQAEQQKLRGQAIELRRLMNRAIEAKDQGNLRDLVRQLLQLQARARQLGLPGIVPKSTEPLLEQAGVQAGEPAFQQ